MILTMVPLDFYILSELPSLLQDFLDSDGVVILSIVCLLLIVIIGFVIFKLYTQTQEINKALAKRATEWAKPIPEELRTTEESDLGEEEKKEAAE